MTTFLQTWNTIRRIWPTAATGLVLAAFTTSLAASGRQATTDQVPVASAVVQAPLGPVDHPLTLDEAVSRAEACNPQVRALRAAVEVARQRKAASSDFEEPEALGGWGNAGDVFGEPVNPRQADTEWRAGARVYVPNPFLIVPRGSARMAEIMAAKADLQAAQWQVECDVRSLFRELDYLSEDTALATDLARDTNEILQDVRTRSAHGAATAAEVVAPAQRRIEMQNTLDLVRHRWQLAQRELAALLDTPVGSLHVITSALPHLPEPTLAPGPLQATALACRGDLVALHWRTLAARSAYREARNVRVPWFKEITAGNRQPSDQWWVGVGVNVPIFSWTKNHAEDVLQAQSTLAGVNETNGVQLVCREVRDALDEVQERQRLAARNQSEIVPLIAEMRRTLDVLRATPNLLAGQVAATEAQFLEASRLELVARWQYQLSLLNLERVLGKPMDAAKTRGM